MAKQTPTHSELADMMPLPKVIADIIYKFGGTPTILTVKVNGTLTIPHIQAIDGFNIDWGDETHEYVSTAGPISHIYKIPGAYIIHITGIIYYLSFKNVIQLVDISQWGNMKPYSCSEMFRGCTNINITARDVPNLDNCRILYKMFYGCELFNSDLSKWDVSKIQSMEYMFSGCALFNSDLSKWNVSRVTYMRHMFSECISFNSTLTKWDVRRVQNMGYMFSGCESFNADLSKWNVSNVIHMDAMFWGCKIFNSDLSGWVVNKVDNMPGMFSGCLNFNSDLSRWNVMNVSNMAYMFSGCKSFNSDLSRWDVKKVTNVEYMFSGC